MTTNNGDGGLTNLGGRAKAPSTLWDVLVREERVLDWCLDRMPYGYSAEDTIMELLSIEDDE